MKKIIATIVTTLLLSTSLLAQSADKATKEINAIKANQNYITAESTVKDWETAYENAKILLTREVEDWLTEQGASNIAGVIAMSNEHILEIKTTRGSLYRAFVYIKKSDLYPYTDKSKLMVVDINEKPDSVPVAIINNSQIVESPSHVALTTEEKNMLFIKAASEIQPYINGKKDANEIDSYGKYSTLPKEGCSYIFIYDKKGNVPACLKYENGIAVNLSTGKEESISANYKGCGGIWFKLK